MKIEIVDGVEKGRVFRFENTAEVTIGRDDQCDVSLADPKVSRRHARIAPREGHLLIEDLGSSNGIRINGLKIHNLVLEEGDKIMLGDAVLIVTGLPPGKPDQRASRMVRVSDRTRTVVLSILPQHKADILGQSPAPEELDALRADHQSLRAISEISQALAGQRGTEETVHAVVGILRTSCEADTACVLTRSKGDKDWTVRAVRTRMAPEAEMQISETIIQQSLDEGVAILCRDPFKDDRFRGSVSIVAEGITSAISSPMRFDGGFNGVLFLDRRNRPDVFTERDLRLTATVANLLGLLLDRDRVEAEARQRARLAVIGEVVANLAHHAKNVIAGLNFGLSNLKSALARKDYDRLPQYVQLFEQQHGRLSEVVLNMLSYSKDRTPVYGTVQVKRMIDSIAQPFGDRLKDQGVALVVDCRPGDIAVWAEEAALHRAILNLFVNSLDALQASKGAAKEIRITAAPHDTDQVDIRFRDTGVGIAVEDMDKVFDIFFSKKGANGTGLGLAVVKKVVTEHGGDVQVTSEPGAWTEFRIRLPTPPAASKGPA
jgi:signal transduction histidine kinase/pSer/pThr/pTyr-binding forkhead associated (FHA) protein